MRASTKISLPRGGGLLRKELVATGIEAGEGEIRANLKVRKKRGPAVGPSS